METKAVDRKPKGNDQISVAILFWVVAQLSSEKLGSRHVWFNVFPF